MLLIQRRKPDYLESMLRHAITSGRPVTIVASSCGGAQRVFDATSAWLNGTPKEMAPG